MTYNRRYIHLFFNNHLAGVKARLRHDARSHEAPEVTGLTPSARQMLDLLGIDELPNNYISRPELIKATNFEYRR